MYEEHEVQLQASVQGKKNVNLKIKVKDLEKVWDNLYLIMELTIAKKGKEEEKIDVELNFTEVKELVKWIIDKS